VRSQKKSGFSTFRHSDTISDWNALPLDRRVQGGASLSGNERDSFFLSKGGKDFTNISGISGLDDPGDGRSVAVLDFDRDGWPDLMVASANFPTFQLYRNQMGDKSSGAVRENRMIAVRLVGGNATAEPSKEWSNRDAVGAVMMADLGGQVLVREHRAGEGLAAQNSPTTLIGIGQHGGVASLKVKWPSGKVQDVGKVAAGTLVTVYENPDQSPGHKPAALKPYKVDSIHPPARRDLAQLR
jgi:ASPIC/UnbV protein/VCBS repeat protein